jgi:hypothetical protein
MVRSDDMSGVLGICAAFFLSREENSMARNKLTTFVCIGSAIILLSANARAASYNAVADFQTASNPGGVWSYGYSPAGGSGYSLVLFDYLITSAVGTGWGKSDYNTLNAPLIWKNTSSEKFAGVAPGQLSLHPGPEPSGDFTVLRFTAPVTSLYDVVGRFFAGDIGSMNASIVLNGNVGSPLKYFSDTTDQSVFHLAPVSILQGQTVDFVVGNNGSFYYGNTPISVTVTAVVPEPETYATMLAGLGLLGFVAARRRKPSVMEG